MAGIYFDERMETLPPDVLQRVQDHRLRWQFKRCWDGSPFYRARFEAAGLSPETFNGLADLERLPAMSQQELLESERADRRVALRSRVERHWLLRSEPLRSETDTDRTHTSDRGARAVWAVGPTTREAWLRGDKDVSPWLGTPSRRYLPPVRESPRKWPNRNLHVAYAGSDLAIQCIERDGHHLVADQLAAEIMDEASGTTAAHGTAGELVLTDLVREASPLIRYRTGLIVIASDEPCPCGRTGLRLWSRSAYRRRQRR